MKVAGIMRENERLFVILLLCVFLFLFEESYVRILLIGAVVIYLALDFYEKKYLSTSDEETVIYCEWESKINETDFLANEESTISSLADIGLTLEKAIGKEHVFHTENKDGNDLYFSGVIIQAENNGFIIRASNVEELQ